MPTSIQTFSLPLSIHSPCPSLPLLPILHSSPPSFPLPLQVIQKHPARQKSHEKIAELEDMLEKLNKTENALNRKLDVRKKQFHLLVHSIHQLQTALEKEGEEMEEEEGDGDTMDLGAMDMS